MHLGTFRGAAGTIGRRTATTAYESHGFRVLCVLDLPKGAPVVTAMWREPGSS